MKKLSIATILTLVMLPLAAYAQGNHEYSPLVEKTVNYKNWSLPNLQTEKNEDLRSLIKDKKLVITSTSPRSGETGKTKDRLPLKLKKSTKNRAFKLTASGKKAHREELKSSF